MRAAVCYEHNTPLVLEDVELLPPRPRDVVVRVDACGVCHSDLSVIDGTYPLPLPALLGHEVVGVVEWVGDQVQRVRTNQRVILASGPVCGECAYCVRGEPYLCTLNWQISQVPRVRLGDSRQAHAIAGLGGFSELVAVDHASVIPIESHLPDEELAIIGCGVSVGVGAVTNTAKVRPGETVSVIGCGGVGLGIVQGARLAGASRVVAIDPKPAKRSAALAQGATDVIDPAGIDVVSAVKELTAGGVDHSFEAVGVAETILEAFRIARQGGNAVVVGFGGSTSVIQLSAAEFFIGGRNFRPSVGSGGNNRHFYPQLVRLAETGKLDLTAFISGRHSLDDINEALQTVQAGDAIREVVIRK
jgi:S-(hydroxymethyl)glutathione dehydrogenase/alcohol dehydrogenase